MRLTATIITALVIAACGDDDCPEPEPQCVTICYVLGAEVRCAERCEGEE